jgi:hypothetical protein
MAWSAPLTAVSNTALTAAQWNASVRDNLLMTAPALATTAGGIFVATGTNAIAQRVPLAATIATSETTGATAYGNLATVGPQVSVTTGTQALALWAAHNGNNTSGQNNYMSVAVSGATTVAASDTWSGRYQSFGANARSRAAGFHWFTSLTAGSNVFTAQYRVDAGTGLWTDRELLVIPF